MHDFDDGLSALEHELNLVATLWPDSVSETGDSRQMRGSIPGYLGTGKLLQHRDRDSDAG